MRANMEIPTLLQCDYAVCCAIEKFVFWRVIVFSFVSSVLWIDQFLMFLSTDTPLQDMKKWEARAEERLAGQRLLDGDMVWLRAPAELSGKRAVVITAKGVPGLDRVRYGNVVCCCLLWCSMLCLIFVWYVQKGTRNLLASANILGFEAVLIRHEVCVG